MSSIPACLSLAVGVSLDIWTWSTPFSCSYGVIDVCIVNILAQCARGHGFNSCMHFSSCLSQFGYLDMVNFILMFIWSDRCVHCKYTGLVRKRSWFQFLPASLQQFRSIIYLSIHLINVLLLHFPVAELAPWEC